MRFSWIVVPFVVAGLTGCAAVLTSKGRETLRADCAAKGMQYVETSVKETDLVFVSHSQVEGVCVGPGDPRYVAPSTPTQ
ncbi:MAG TPA: hypothetical protein VKR31_08920 [Rhizomicrobium sp.]|nr:hypothetical protein [Rhizomicrobium sp.]